MRKNENIQAPRRLVLLYSLLHYLDKSAEVLVADASGGVVERLLSWQGWSWKRLASRSLLESYGAWVEPGSLAAVRLLAESSGMIEYSGSLAAGLSTSPPERIRLRSESLDGGLSGLQNLALLYINDLGIPAILAGGVETIAHHRPVIVVPHSRVSADYLVTWCQGNDYQLFDNTLSPVDYIAVPAELSWLVNACQSALQRGEIDPLGLPQVQLVSAAGDLDGHAPYIYGLPGLSHALDTCNLPLDLSAVWAAQGWYAAEGGQMSGWRWSGPMIDSRVLLPVPSPGAYCLTLKLNGFVHECLSGKGQVFVDGVYKGSLVAGDDNVCMYDIDVSAKGFVGFVDVQLSLPETIQPSVDDTRRLGVSLSAISVSWRG